MAQYDKGTKKNWYYTHFSGQNLTYVNFYLIFRQVNLILRQVPSLHVFFLEVGYLHGIPFRIWHDT